MKKLQLFAVVLAMVLTACATGSAANKKSMTIPADKSEIMGITWYLVEIRDGNGNMLLGLNRSKLDEEGNGDVYSLRFDQENRVFGKAAPNTYRGPCIWGGSYTLTFGAMASTMMASIKAQPAGLEEYAYYEYLKKVNGWGLTIEDRLELYCEDESGQAILVFAK